METQIWMMLRDVERHEDVGIIGGNGSSSAVSSFVL